MTSTTPSLPTTTSSLLLCEALGFSPQLLLDDIINISNNAVQDGVNGMEEFLVKWVEEREERKAKEVKEPEPPAKGKKGKKKAAEQPKEPEDMNHEIEQGLVAFQTLLEYHTDIAFDFFEAWSLRNIFFIPPELEKGGVVVLPHYEGADLSNASITGGSSKAEAKERELMEEIDELRKRLDEQRRLTRLLTRALATTKAAKRRADKRYTDLVSIIPPESLPTLRALPNQLLSLYQTVSSLPPVDPSLIHPAPSQDPAAGGGGGGGGGGGSIGLSGTGKREWEVGSSGYVNWAVQKLVSGARPSVGGSTATTNTGVGKDGSGMTWVDQMEQVTAYVATAQDVKGALEAFSAATATATAKQDDDDDLMDVE
ncbi:hypothetical protein MD484_g7965, partial [Candolleomyces efflorescens]